MLLKIFVFVYKMVRAGNQTNNYTPKSQVQLKSETIDKTEEFLTKTGSKSPDKNTESNPRSTPPVGEYG